MSRLWDTEVPWPEPMNETEAAKALTAWEQRLREERDGRDLPPEPGDDEGESGEADDVSGAGAVDVNRTTWAIRDESEGDGLRPPRPPTHTPEAP